MINRHLLGSLWKTILPLTCHLNLRQLFVLRLKKMAGKSGGDEGLEAGRDRHSILLGWKPFSD